MKMITAILLPGLLCLVALLAGCSGDGTAGPDTQQSPRVAKGDRVQVPVPGMVTMVDLGAKSCIPCKMMAPILKELEEEYRGRAAIIFIDVKEDFTQVDRFGIRAIPTQIFYDRQGREVKRHVGFMDKRSIVAELNKLGVE
jgi:thioredoxin 1